MMGKKDRIGVEHPGRPWRNAERFLHRHYMPGDDYRLRHYRGVFYEWGNGVFRPRDVEAVISDPWKFFEESCYYEKQGEKIDEKDFLPNTRKINEIVQA